MKTIATILSASAILVALAAPGQAAAVTNAEWIAQADAICAQAAPKNVRLLKSAQQAFNRDKLKAGSRILIKVESFQATIFKRIGALPLPSDQVYTGLVDGWLALQTRQGRAQTAFARAVLKGRPVPVLNRLNARANKLLRQAAAVGRQIGFKNC